MITLSGKIVHGEARGRELGYPTANVDMTGEQPVPSDGVYGAIAHLSTPPGQDPICRLAAISVGTNPTFSGTTRTFEATYLTSTKRSTATRSPCTSVLS